MSHRSLSSAFTLIELLVVIAIIAVLSVVVILSLNPTELLRQARDANRISDMATLSTAVNLFLTDSGGIGTLGMASTSYMSVADSSATSSIGDQCQGLGLPALATSSGQNWQCGASSTFRKVDSTGWVPVNFGSLSSGSPLGQLPTDPINQTSSGLFYTYAMQGSQYAVTSLLESQKYKSLYGTTPQNLYFPGVIIQGNAPSVSVLYNPTGLVGWWPMDEGTGTIAQDKSGNGNGGTLSSPAPTWTPGKVGSGALSFNGSTNYVVAAGGTTMVAASSQQVSIMAWVNKVGAGGAIAEENGPVLFTVAGVMGNSSYEILTSSWKGVTSAIPINAGTWYHLVIVYDGTLGLISNYVNGLLDGTSSQSGTLNSPINCLIIGRSTTGGCNTTTGGSYSGLIDDLRIYNRALSAAEVQALYNATK